MLHIQSLSAVPQGGLGSCGGASGQPLDSEAVVSPHGEQRCPGIRDMPSKLARTGSKSLQLTGEVVAENATTLMKIERSRTRDGAAGMLTIMLHVHVIRWLASRRRCLICLLLDGGFPVRKSDDDLVRV